MVKLASQLLHLKGFFHSSIDAMCPLKLVFRAKIASQTVHLKDFVPPCVLCLTHGPVRLYPMHKFKTLNSKTWDESRVMIVLNIKNWNENRVVQLEEN